MVVDPDNKFNNYEDSKNYVIFKERGVVFVNQGEISNEQYGDGLVFDLSSKQVTKFVNSISIYNIGILLALFYLVTNTLDMLFELFTLSIIFGSFYYFLSTLVSKTHPTYFQNIKRILFLSIYLCLGFITNFILGGGYPYLPFIIFAIAYFLLLSKKVK